MTAAADQGPLPVPGATGTSTRVRFCTKCGRPLEAGGCRLGHDTTPAGPPGGDTPVPSPAPAPPVPPPPRRSRRALVVAAASALAGALLVAAAAVQGHQIGELNDEITALEARQRTTDRAVTLRSKDEALSNLATRLSDLEATAASEPDLGEVARRVQASVFTVETDEGIGTAFVVSSSGGVSQLITNYHVVADSWGDAAATVELSQDERVYTGRVVDTDLGDDLALIEVSATLVALHWAGERPRVGDSVIAVGSPLGLGGTVSTGIVSAFRTEEGLEYLQFSAPVSPGNSGGPVVDRSGAVVGVTVGKVVEEGVEGLSFAIPYERACGALGLCLAPGRTGK